MCLMFMGIYIYKYVMFSVGPYGNLTHMQEFSLICYYYLFLFFLLTSLITNIVYVFGIWVGVCVFLISFFF